VSAGKSFFRLFPAGKGEPANSGDVALEPIYPRSYDLSYMCLLVPRPNIQLAGKLAVMLEKWLREICAEHDWRVEFVNVAPDYLQWGLQAAPSVQAAQFMKVIRSRTAALALSKFAKLCGENTNEFWVPGYLAVLGTQPHSQEMIEQYIRTTRHQQASSD
jgi:REP element-mobilizing transposase RayT